TMMRVLAGLNGLINVAGGGAPAAHSAYVIALMRGTYRTAEGALEPFLLADGIGVGYGARPNADGIDAVYFV
ncbi:hydantoinase B/oxoprolinase family protein, partial [Stenotrophomonas maltophilia]|uniref:hydantoinase B/oxoprolinase family protein n=1 Tax=Stenotrophomonas maltophilia TaxID=40324 RepID=UPI0013D957F1